MQTKNENDKYQVASTDEYGIKTTKGGQKYLICHFINDDFVDKYTYENVIKNENLSTSVLLEKGKDAEEYFYEPFVHRAIGYVVSDYNGLKGFSVENANTDKKGDEELTKNKQECEFIEQLSDKLEKFEPHHQYNLSDDYWKQLEEAVNGISGNLTFAEKMFQIEGQYLHSGHKECQELVQHIMVFENLQNMAQFYNCKTIKELKDIIENENKINSVPENNQMNISGAKISSLIINITNKIFRRVSLQGGVNNSKQDRLKEIVKNINEIIEIQYNKLGHKSILVRDAESKKITKMELDKFVDYIKDECKKAGITEEQIKQINPDFPTKKKVHKMIEKPLQVKYAEECKPPKKHGRWCRFKKWFKNLFSFNYHDKNNAHASYDTNVIKNDINTMIYSNM